MRLQRLKQLAENIRSTGKLKTGKISYGLEQIPKRKPNIWDDLEKCLRDGNLTLFKREKQNAFGKNVLNGMQFLTLKFCFWTCK